jgi:hypothetical protein
MFRQVSSTLAVLMLIGAVMGVVKKTTTPRAMAIPVFGTIALAAFSFWLQSITDWRLSIFGLMILFVVYYLQDGIVGFFRKLFFRRVALGGSCRHGRAAHCAHRLPPGPAAQQRLPHEESPIGIIVCRHRNATVVEYALRSAQRPIGVATYSVVSELPEAYREQLPSAKQIAERLGRLGQAWAKGS